MISLLLAGYVSEYLNCKAAKNGVLKSKKVGNYAGPYVNELAY
jgi:hypothetical protein